MYEKFTDRARKVMHLADEEARRLYHEYIGTEHILLALARENTGVAANVLKQLDANPMRIRAEIEKIVSIGPADAVWLGRLPQTPRAKKVIEYAIEEAHAFDHNYIGTEHLLLGLLREIEGLAAQVLMNLGINLATCRQEVRKLLDHPQTEPAPSSISPQEDPGGPDLGHLPQRAREVVSLFDRQLDLMQQDKEEFVAAQQWEQAAALRDVQAALNKIEADFIRLWQKK